MLAKNNQLHEQTGFRTYQTPTGCKCRVVRAQNWLVPASRSRRNAGRIAMSLTREIGAIAQLGERIVRNDEVVGSIPTSSTMFSITCAASLRINFNFLPFLLEH